MVSLNKRKKSLTLILIFLITLNMISFASSIFSNNSGNFALSSSDNIDNMENSGEQKQSAEPYSVDWGKAMDAAPNAVDIDSNPSYDLVCAITGLGSRIQYCNYTSSETSETWKNLCFIPDQISYAERLAVFPANNELKTLFFLVTRSGELYEATSYELGGQMQWYKHDIELLDIATSRHLDEAKAISKDGKKLYQYIPFNRTWKTVYTFDKPNWYPYSDKDVGYPLRLDLDSYGNAMVLTTKGNAFYYNDEYEWRWWSRGNPGINKVVSDITVSRPYLTIKPRVPSGFIVGMGENDPYSIMGYHIFKHNVGTGWYKCNGRLVSITTSRQGEPWGINKLGEVFHGKSKGELPDVPCYVTIYLSKTLYYDNFDNKYGEMRVKGYVNGKLQFKLDRHGVKDGGTVHWFHVFGKEAFFADNKPFQASQDVTYKLLSYEKDYWGNADDHYPRLIKSINVKQQCGLGLYEFTAGEIGLLKITTYYYINSYSERTNIEEYYPGRYLVEKVDGELPGELFLVKPPSIRDSTPNWAVGETYHVGDKVVYNGIIYSCIQSHTVYDPNWTPPNTPALWKQEY